MKHLNFLDGLRALSIFAVLAFHGLGPVTSHVPAGWLGVDVFFVISGFLITSLLLRERLSSGTVSLKNFYIRRGLRLMPVYWTYLLVVLALYFKASPNEFKAFCTAGLYMSDYDIALGWGNILGSGYESTWSLAVEEKFYFLWPALVLFFGMRSSICAVISIIACEAFKAYLVMHHVTASLPYRILGGFDCHVDELMIGCLAAHIMTNPGTRAFILKHSKDWLALLTVVAFGVVWATTPYPAAVKGISHQLMLNVVRLPIFSILAAMVIMQCAANQQLIAARILAFPVFTWIGRLSYSLYLWHGHVVFQSEKTGFGAWVAHNPYKRELLNFGMCIAAACISYYLIERPFLKLKGKFAFKEKSVDSGVPAIQADISHKKEEPALV